MTHAGSLFAARFANMDGSVSPVDHTEVLRTPPGCGSTSSASYMARCSGSGWVTCSVRVTGRRLQHLEHSLLDEPVEHSGNAQLAHAPAGFRNLDAVHR